MFEININAHGTIVIKINNPKLCPGSTPEITSEIDVNFSASVIVPNAARLTSWACFVLKPISFLHFNWSAILCYGINKVD